MDDWGVLSGIGAIAAAGVAIWQAVVANRAARDAKESAENANKAADESNRLNRQIVKLQRAEQHRAVGQFVVDEAGESAFTVVNPGPTRVEEVKVTCFGFHNPTALWGYAKVNEPQRFHLKRKAERHDRVELEWRDADDKRHTQSVEAPDIWGHLADR